MNVLTAYMAWTGGLTVMLTGIITVGRIFADMARHGAALLRLRRAQKNTVDGAEQHLTDYTTE